MTTIRFRPSAVRSSGRRESWMKHVTGCDASKTNGYAFDGDFLKASREVDLPVGAILIRVDPEGSVKNNWQSGHVFRLQADGELDELTEGNLDWRDDFLTIRDIVFAAISGESEESKEPANPLAGFSTEDLLAELRRRETAERPSTEAEIYFEAQGRG